MEEQERLWQGSAPANPLAALARQALEHYVKTGLHIDFSAGAPHEGTAPSSLPDGLPARAGVAVELKVNGVLRGGAETTKPTQPTLLLEVVNAAISAGTYDPRFPPVAEAELPFLEYTVEIVDSTQPTN